MYQENNNFRYAGFWMRVMAFILDHLILGFIKAILIFPFSVALSFGSMFSRENNDFYFASYTFIETGSEAAAVFAFLYTLVIMFILNTIVEWLYYAFFESSKKMATPGKFILGLKVTDFSGSRISFGKATGRYFSKFLSSMILGIGYIMAAFTERKQTLHDILANCFVIYNYNHKKIEIPDDFHKEKTNYPKDYII